MKIQSYILDVIEPQKVFIGLGSNLGDREGFLEKGRIALARLSENSMRCSGVYESPSFGVENLPLFLNQVVEIETELTSFQLLCFLKGTEILLGRKQRERWHSRELDLDILLYGNDIEHSPYLSLPHPQISRRQFVLAPLLELASELRNPLTGIPYREDLDRRIAKEGVLAMEYPGATP